jgi:hypothetical protein
MEKRKPEVGPWGGKSEQGLLGAQTIYMMRLTVALPTRTVLSSLAFSEADILPAAG